MVNFFMVKIHPTKDLIMVQIDNDKIELNAEYQEKLYEILKKELRINNVRPYLG